LSKEDVKISRKELKEDDEFISFATMVLEQIVKYRMQIIAAVAAVVLIVSVIEIWKWWDDRKNAAASEMLFGIQEKLNGKGNEDDLDITVGSEKRMDSVKSLEKLIGEYPSTDAARIAELEIASLKMDLGDYAGAIKNADKFLSGKIRNDLIHQEGLQLKGFALLKSGDAAGAAGIFRKIADSKDASAKDQVLLNLGIALEKSGDKKGAADAFGRIGSEIPNSPLKDLADAKVSELTDASEKAK